MLEKWLEANLRDGIGGDLYEVIDVTELMHADDSVVAHMAESLRNARWQPAYLEQVAEALGWDQVAESVKARAPTAKSARRGQFGEVLTTGLLETFDGYAIPVEKLRYAISAAQSQPGVDTLAFQLAEDGSISEVCWVESKLRTGPDRSVAAMAVTQLTRDVDEKPPAILEFVGQRLFETHHELFRAFLEYLSLRRDTREMERYRVFIVVDAEISCDPALEDLEASEPALSPLHVHLVSIADLRGVTDRAFDSIGIEHVIDDE